MQEPGEAGGTGGDAAHFCFPFFLHLPPWKFLREHEIRGETEIKGCGERWGGGDGRQSSHFAGGIRRFMVFHRI